MPQRLAKAEPELVGGPITFNADAGDSGMAIDTPPNPIPAIVRNRPQYRQPKIPPIHYLETNEHWLSVCWALRAMRFDIMESSYYLNNIDISRRVYRGAAAIAKRLPIR
jgi:hypothetical protein